MKIQTWWSDLGDETMMESAWERQMLQDGLAAFDQSNIRKDGSMVDAGETKAGRKLILDLIPAATEGILETQKTLMGQTLRIDRKLRASVIAPPADVAAMMTLKSIMNLTYSADVVDLGASFQITCKKVGQIVESELNFRHWVATSKAEAKEYAKKVGLPSTPMSLAERVVKENGGSCRKSLLRWKKQFVALNEENWSTGHLLYVGEALVRSVVGSVPEAMEIHKVFQNGKSPNYVRLTEEFLSLMAQKHASFASFQVVKKPMLAKPDRWEKAVLD